MHYAVGAMAIEQQMMSDSLRRETPIPFRFNNRRHAMFRLTSQSLQIILDVDLSNAVLYHTSAQGARMLHYLTRQV